MSKKHPWEANGWVRGRQLESGVQGFSFLARRQSDPAEQFNYVLKKLARQSEMNRRAMFCNEIRAVGVLDHPGSWKSLKRTQRILGTQTQLTLFGACAK